MNAVFSHSSNDLVSFTSIFFVSTLCFALFLFGSDSLSPIFVARYSIYLTRTLITDAPTTKISHNASDKGLYSIKHTDTIKTMRMEGSNKSRYGHGPSDMIILYSHIHKRKHQALIRADNVNRLFVEMKL